MNRHLKMFAPAVASAADCEPALVGPRALFLTVEQFCERNPAFTPSALRNHIFRAEPRKSSRGEVPGNGLVEAGAIIRLGRRVLIDEGRFLAWVAQAGGGWGGGQHIPEPRTSPSTRLAGWVDALDRCRPNSPEAIEVYQEAAQAGLVDDLLEALRNAAAANRREAELLDADRARRNGR